LSSHLLSAFVIPTHLVSLTISPVGAAASSYLSSSLICLIFFKVMIYIIAWTTLFCCIIWWGACFAVHITNFISDELTTYQFSYTKGRYVVTVLIGW